MSKLQVSDIKEIRQMLGASTAQMAAMLGLREDFIKAHESTVLPMPLTVEKLLRYVVQGLHMTSSVSQYSAPANAYMWCEPVHTDEEIQVPMVYHTVFPRMQVLVLSPANARHYTEAQNNGVILQEMPLDGKTWLLGINYIDIPVLDPSVLIVNMAQIAAQMIRKGRVDYKE